MAPPLLKARRTGNTRADLRGATLPTPREDLPTAPAPDATMPRDGPPHRASHGAGSITPPDNVAWHNVVCTKCNKPPAAGTKLNKCASCLTAAYCGADCQRADWASHKLDCKALGKEHERSVAAQAAEDAIGRPKRNQKFLFEWFHAIPGLASKVENLAWQHRGSSPVMLVHTSPDGTDASAPRVTVVPRSEWEHDARWRSQRDNFSVMFNRDGFDASKQYVIRFFLQHPDSETWPKVMAVKCFSADAAKMDLKIVLQALLSASTPGEQIAAHARAASFLSAHPEMEMEIELHTDGSRIRLTGLRGAAHLNGREGVIRGADPANSARVIVHFADGSEVSVKRHNCLGFLV